MDRGLDREENGEVKEMQMEMEDRGHDGGEDLSRLFGPCCPARMRRSDDTDRKVFCDYTFNECDQGSRKKP